jgi:hypothetical protein
MFELLEHAATVAILSTFISESKLLSPIRNKLNFDLLYCPICLSFWVGAIYLYSGIGHYFLTLAIANVFMLIVLKVYRELDEASDAD